MESLHLDAVFSTKWSVSTIFSTPPYLHLAEAHSTQWVLLHNGWNDTILVLHVFRPLCRRLWMFDWADVTATLLGRTAFLSISTACTQRVVPWAVSGKTLAKHSLNDKSKITPTHTHTHTRITLINQANEQTVSHTYIYINRHSQLVKHCACFVFAFLLSPVPLEPMCCHQFCCILFPFKWLIAAI